MILQAYTIFDKKAKCYTPYQFTKDIPDVLAETYERSALKNVKDFDQYRGMVLKHVGIFDDKTGILEALSEFNDVIDFDSLILDVKELKDE